MQEELTARHKVCFRAFFAFMLRKLIEFVC